MPASSQSFLRSWILSFSVQEKPGTLMSSPRLRAV